MEKGPNKHSDIDNLAVDKRREKEILIEENLRLVLKIQFLCYQEFASLPESTRKQYAKDWTQEKGTPDELSVHFINAIIGSLEEDFPTFSSENINKIVKSAVPYLAPSEDVLDLQRREKQREEEVKKEETHLLALQTDRLVSKIQFLCYQEFASLPEFTRKQYAKDWTQKTGTPDELTVYLIKAIMDPLSKEFPTFSSDKINEVVESSVPFLAPPEAHFDKQEKMLNAGSSQYLPQFNAIEPRPIADPSNIEEIVHEINDDKSKQSGKAPFSP